MITTNLPHLVRELHPLGLLSVHDHLDTMELLLPATVDTNELDDIICDAIFADPMQRVLVGGRWVVLLAKRSELRGASDMRSVPGEGRVGYVLQAAA